MFAVVEGETYVHPTWADSYIYWDRVRDGATMDTDWAINIGLSSLACARAVKQMQNEKAEKYKVALEDKEHPHK